MLGKKYREIRYFFAPIKKELDNGKTTTYKLKFIDSFRFMSCSLSNPAGNLFEIYSKKCGEKYCKSKFEYKGPKSNKRFIGLVSVRINI